MAVMVTPGSTAPLSSATVPRSSPCASCAYAGDDDAAIITTPIDTRSDFMRPSPGESVPESRYIFAALHRKASSPNGRSTKLGVVVRKYSRRSLNGLTQPVARDGTRDEDRRESERRRRGGRRESDGRAAPARGQGHREYPVPGSRVDARDCN